MDPKTVLGIYMGFIMDKNRAISDNTLPPMEVTLLRYTDIDLVARAIRVCADSVDKLDSVGNTVGDSDLKLIMHCLNNGHHSVFEHSVYTFEIKNMSRDLLQELSRHRMASPSVQSTRWALKKLIGKLEVGNFEEQAMGYLRSVDPAIDAANVNQLWFVLNNISNYPNDKLKYALPGAFLTTEILTINTRSLWNLLHLRLSKRALWEFRELARLLLELCNAVHPYLYKQFV